MRDLANDEMVAGYMDGGNLDIPEPSENRSHSYRHSFAVRRAEVLRKEPLLPAADLRELAEIAEKKDADA